MPMFRPFKTGRRRQLERQGPADKKRRAKDAQTKQLRRPVMKRFFPALAVLAVWLVAAFAIFYRTPHPMPDLELRQRAPVTIVAHVDFAYEDAAATSEARELAARSVPPVYRMQPAQVEASMTAFRELLALLAEGAAAPVDPESAVGRAVSQLDANQRDLLWRSFGDTSQVDAFLRTLSLELREGVPANESMLLLSDAGRVMVVRGDEHRPQLVTETLQPPSKLARKLAERLVGQQEIALDVEEVGQVLTPLIQPNIELDQVLTDAAKARARLQTAPVKRLVEKGTLLLERGTRVSESHLAMIEAYYQALSRLADAGLERLRLRENLSRLGLVLVLLVAASLYLSHQHPDLVARKLTILLIATLTAVQIALVWGAAEVLRLLQIGSPTLIVPALPLALTPLLLALLLGLRAGLSAAVVLPAVVVLCTTSADRATNVLVLGIVTALVGVIAIHKSRTRIQTFRSALWITTAAVFVESLYLLYEGKPGQAFLQVLAVIAISSFVTVLAVNLLLPLCEFLFRMTTNISLLELSDLNHPLLKRLQLEAPGTYHHTLMVATLAEHAAEAIGANTLLTRVACYFHDIGKLANPSYFTENSFGQNRHEELSPRMSTMVILNHVKEGLAMATKYKLKEPIREAIATHHGTSLVYFFYRRALDAKQIGDDADIENFRYPGPAPQSREASIICLADSCEAASRSLEKPTPQKIDAQVTDIFHNKLLTGQLDQSQLTMAELNIVIETIKKTLHTMLHGRVAYPRFSETDATEPAKKVAPRRPPAAANHTDTVVMHYPGMPDADARPDRARGTGRTDRQPGQSPEDQSGQ